MRNSVETTRINIGELIFFLIGVLLLVLLIGIVANGQSETLGTRAPKAHAQVQQPLYREYRGVRLDMTAADVRAKLGEPSFKSDEQDFFIISANETAQIAYNAAQRVMTISTDYASGVGAPDYRNVVGEGLLVQRPDGSVFRMVMYDSERFWVSYNKSATTVPVVTITISAYK
jgi:hypothetical protein